MPDFDTLNALVHPDHELVTPESLVEGGSYVGARGYRDWLATFSDVYGESWEVKIEDAKDLDAEQVLLTCLPKVRGVRSGAEVGQRFWILMRVVDGKLARSAFYTDADRALEAAALAE